MTKPNVIISTDLPDPRVLNALSFVRTICLIAVAVIATIVLSAWLSPAMGRVLPAGWELMKANTALCALFCAASLALFHPRFSIRFALTSRLSAILVMLLAGAVLFEYVTGRALGIDTLLASDSLSQHPGKISPHAAFCFLLLGIILVCMRARRQVVSHIVDGLTLCLVFLILISVSGYCFGAIHLFGISTHNPTSPQTLLCLFLLTMVVFTDRSRSSLFCVLLGGGIAGKNARLALPLTLTLPFLVALLRGLVVNKSLMEPEYATAFASSSSAMLFFCLILLLSWRIYALERKIQDLSLRDELTRLYNRRGFYVLATHDLQLARRSGIPFSVLFFDLDNLKQINDTLGHEVGSELLQEFAVILSSTIRATDIVGRVGGDEFVIAGNSSAAEIERIVKRIAEATANANARHNRSYFVRYSLGRVTCQPGVADSLDDLLDQADKIMYQAKREKRAAQTAPVGGRLETLVYTSQ